LRLDQLVTSAGDTVKVLAMKLLCELIAINSVNFRAIPVIQFHSRWLEAVVGAANNNTA
jgi:hypothetical protein